jgi:hypothetical protein
VCVCGVGLAALPGREDPGPRRQLGRHIDNLLTSSEESHRYVMADPAAALDRPDAVRELADIAPHRGEPGFVGGVPATTEDRLVRGHHLDRH